MSDRHPCPYCGHRVLDAAPGSYEICPVRFREDDVIQFWWPTMPGEANQVSPIEAQRSYQDFGACDQHGRQYIRPPAEDEPLAPARRPIDLTRDSFEDWKAEDRAPWPDDCSVLCWSPHLLAPGPPMTTHIERPVQRLDDSTGPSYDARAEPIRIGSDAIPAAMDRLPSLCCFGQLTAIEAFKEVGDPLCGPALIGLPKSDNPTVHEWATTALASLEIDGAVKPLRCAHRARLERATPPDWSEPVGIRNGPASPATVTVSSCRGW
ncbi:CPCC family cysteine-rich protein [Streptomyces sp. NPDC058442]|uniref:CPCC family cysteine-rich protein n=1 Tax=Streptomyces sp. NPDC058442 TaxID=3346503 RepID=UPI00365CDD2B